MESAVQTQAQSSAYQEIFRYPISKIPGGAVSEINPLTDAERAYYQLRESILSLELQPGSIIRDADIMKTLGLGRTPIREALKRLEVEMLVESLHRRGTYVRKINLAEIKNQYQIRRQLICLAAGLAADFPQATGPSPGSLRAIYDFLRSGQDCFTIILGVVNLDLGIARATANRHLWQTLDQYYGYARRCWMYIGDQINREDFFLGDYQAILMKIGQGMGEEASLLMAEHVDKAHLAVVNCFLHRYV